MHPEFKDKEFDLEFPGKLLERFTIGNLSDPQSYYFDDGKTRWYHPSSVPEMLDLMNANPSAKIVNGNTEVGIETRFKSLVYPVLIYPRDVVELKSLEIHQDGVTFGGATTIAQFQSILLEFVGENSKFKPWQVRGFQALLDNIKWFAGNQIRNVAAISGNIVTASPISDLNPVFVAMVSLI